MRIRLYIIIKLYFLFALVLMKSAYAEKIDIAVKEIEITDPKSHIPSTTKIYGDIEFEKSWLHKKFPDVYAKEVEILFYVDKRFIQKGILKRTTEKAASWQVLLNYETIRKMTVEEINSINKGIYRISVNIAGIEYDVAEYTGD